MTGACVVELVESIDALQRHRAAYDALLAAMPGVVRRTYSIEALRITAPLYVGAHDTPWFLLAWRGDKLCGIAPLLLRRRGWPRLRRLHAWGDVHGMMGLDPIVLIPDPADEQRCMRAYAEFLSTGKAASAYDVLTLQSVREDSTLGRCFAAAFEGSTHRVEDQVSHLADFPESAAAYRASLDKPMMKELRRCERGLERLGTVEFSSPDRLTPDELDAVLCIHGARQSDLAAQGNERLNLSEAPLERQVFMQLLEMDVRLGSAHCHLLKLDGRVVAFCIGYVSEGVMVWHATAFDPALRKYGPGRVVAMRMFEAEIDRFGTRCVDMGKGTTQIKREFANRRVAHLQFEWRNAASMHSRARRTVWSALSRLAKIVRKGFAGRLNPVVGTGVVTQFASEIATYAPL